MSKLSQTALYGEVLTDEELYRRDIAQLPRYSKADEAGLIERARTGKSQARHAVILSRIGYITSLARRYANLSQAHPHRIEFLDLVQIGNVEALERLDKALASPNPIGYLNKAIRGAMINYVERYVSLIRTGATTGGKLHAPIFVESFDAPPTPSGEREAREYEEALVDRLVTETRLPQPEEHYEALYQAIETLPERHQEVIKRHYGIGCAPETLNRIGIEMSVAAGFDVRPGQGATALRRERTALKQLREVLNSIDVCA